MTYTSPFILHRGYTFHTDNIAWREDGARLQTMHSVKRGPYIHIGGQHVYFNELREAIEACSYDS